MVSYRSIRLWYLQVRKKMYIWKTRSTNNEMINAALRLLKPAEQNPTGKEDFAAYWAFEDHIWPPWSHSQMILSFPLCNCTIIRVARTAQIIMTNVQRNLQTRIQMYDRFENARMLTNAKTATAIPIPP